MTSAPRLRSNPLQLVAMGALLVATCVHAELVQIAWNEGGGFQHTFALPPAQFAEACGIVGKGRSVAWSFKADRALEFNVHYHAGERVVFPEKRDRVAAGNGVLEVNLDQEYCWMWTNGTPADVTLYVELQR